MITRHKTSVDEHATMMPSKLKFGFWFAVLAVFAPAVAHADAWGVGAAGGTYPGLSVQFAPESVMAYHASASYEADATRISIDMQRHHTPRIGYGRSWRLSFYGGLGVTGAARRDDETPEAYHARLPVGAQCDVRDLHLSLFAEVAALLGELPMTKLGRAAAVGARATF